MAFQPAKTEEIQEIARKKESVLNRDRSNVAPKIYRPGDPQVPHFARGVDLPNVSERRKPAGA